MHPAKYLWALRALVYKPFFKYICHILVSLVLLRDVKESA